MSNKEKENQVQAALGTMKRQMFVSADLLDAETLYGAFKKALENFGLFIYTVPDMSDMHHCIVSNEKLNEHEIRKLFHDDWGDSDWDAASDLYYDEG